VTQKLIKFPFSGLRSALLERKLSFLEKETEQRESLLGEVLKVSNVEPTAMSTRIEKLLAQKNERICDLRYELARVTKSHDDMLEVFKAKMIKYGIPIEELGPALPANLRRKMSASSPSSRGTKR
jgi:growth arrest-specific protein 8